MRIVDRLTFLNLPAGTLFAKYRPCVFEDLCIKGESSFFDGGNDFFYQAITDSIDCQNSEEFSNILNRSDREGTIVRFDFNCEDRDGLFDEDQKFAVWDYSDVKALINRLQQAVNR